MPDEAAVRAPMFLLAICLAFLCSAKPPKVPLADLEAGRRLERDFIAYQPHYKEMRSARVSLTRSLAAQVFAQEAAGKNTACSHQILFELETLLVSSADFAFIDQRLHDLQISLDNPAQQRQALERDPQDGSWGACYRAWFLKVYASYDQLEKNAVDSDRKIPLPRFLEQLSTPALLTSYLRSIAVSDVPATGIDHEREFNEMLSTLTRMLIRGKPENYAVPPELKSRMLSLVLGEFRNPQTGWWGERYQGNGVTEFVDDLNITFHEVSYLKGKVPDMPKVIATAIAVKDLNYPVG